MDESESHDVSPELRAALCGRRAILVGNRREPEIEGWLLEALGVRVRWVDCNNTRKLESAREALRSGNYDFVLVATSFVGHDVDQLLKPACKKVGTLYVPVGKGRPAACLAALRRCVDDLSTVEGGL